MKTMAAGKFKDLCLKTLDEVVRTRSAVVITKRGRPVAMLVPCAPEPRPSFEGSVLSDSGDPHSTGEAWEADPA